MTHLPRQLTLTLAASLPLAAVVLAGPAAAAPGTFAPLPQTTFEVNELTAFTSPSGNIGCLIDTDQVRCDIAERDWTPSPRPASCPAEVGWGQGVQLSVGEPADLVCAGDTTLGTGDPLAYGDKIVAGSLECTSQEAGILCWDFQYGGEFLISRQTYDVR